MISLQKEPAVGWLWATSWLRPHTTQQFILLSIIELVGKCPNFSVKIILASNAGCSKKGFWLLLEVKYLKIEACNWEVHTASPG